MDTKMYEGVKTNIDYCCCAWIPFRTPWEDNVAEDITRFGSST